jgi:cobalt-precorrin-5B (C1)-methyltransferase
MKGKHLRSGITTGASAAAAAGAAAALLFAGRRTDYAVVVNLQGKEITVPIHSCRAIANEAVCSVIKDGGDDPDITNGLEITASVRRAGPGAGAAGPDGISDAAYPGITIAAGPGVGRVTKPGLQVAVGEPAINPVPRQMIAAAVAAGLPPDERVLVTISVPGGEEAVRRTLNPKLGIVGGISILGTTGIVEPMSEEAFKNSLVPQISMARAYGYDTVVLTPGRIGERWAVERLGVPQEAVIQMSNFVGFMLRACADHGVRKVLLLGHHSKLTKVAAGCFHTHNKVADGRLETLAAWAGIIGAAPGVMAEIMAANTSEGAVEILRREGLMAVFRQIAGRASQRASEHVYGDLTVGALLLTMAGEPLGYDDNAKTMGREMGWHIQSM